VDRHVPVRHRRHKSRGPRAAALALALGALVIAGCGGGGGDTTSSSSTAATSTSTATSPTSTTSTQSSGGGADGSTVTAIAPKATAGDVRKAVDAVLTSSDPAVACGQFVTQRFLQVAYGGRQGCVQAQGPGSAAKSLTSYKAELNGRTATATAKPVGGPYDGAKIKVSLVRGGPGYQVDALHSNVQVGP
jgi:ABC-type glycerol-3-phosphate transport system substrate-binding protein